MTSDGTQDGTAGASDSIAAALDAWAAQPSLAPVLRGGHGCYLVLSGDAARVLHASESARPLAASLADAAGLVPDSLRLGEQIGRAGLAAGSVSLVRLQLDTRRRALPVTGLLARGKRLSRGSTGDGSAVILLAFDKPVSARLRRPPATAPAEAAPKSLPADSPPVAPEPVLLPGTRLVWRSDADGCFGEASGGASRTLRGLFSGESWTTLAASGRLVEGRALLAAIEARGSFRAVPVVVVLTEPERRLALEVSGAPLARLGRPFEGYGGFALVRSAAEGMAGACDLPEDNSLPPAAVPPRTVSAEPAPAPSPRAPGSAPHGDGAPMDTPTEPTPQEPAEDGPPLSVNEHAAFREIAKALGARFAGDEEEPADARTDTVAGFRAAAGSVTPFPSRTAEVMPGDAAALLDGIPAGLLVCRGETLIHANRRLLDLADFPDLATLLAEGGLARLFRGLPPQRHAGAWAVAMTARDGRTRDTDVEQARMVWLGEPADCLLVRPRDEGGAGRGDAAVALADTVVQGRASDAEAALDDLDDAVLSLDGADRVLSLNRAAAALFGCEPREVVGGGVADLFSPEGANALRGIMRTPGAGTCEVVVRAGPEEATRQLRLAPRRADGRRTAILSVASHAEPQDDGAARETAARDPGDFAEQIGRELRMPVTGIVGSAEAMLEERYGPLGDERYRGTVRDIRSSGEQVLALVDDLTELSRLEAGRRELAFGPLTLNDVVADCVAHLQPQAAGGRVLLRTSFAADLPAVTADEPSLRQAAFAVIACAIRDTAAGGQVIVSTTQAERGEVALRVRDTGGGVPDSAPPPAAPPPRKDGATGLGLPLTRALVEANHGRFRVSGGKDEGTLVEMLFSVRETALRA